MTFPHDGCLITINQLSYHDPGSHTSPNKPIPFVAYVESMHYVSTTTINVDRTRIGCEHITLVPPPHHLDVEVVKFNPHLGEATSYVSPIFGSNFFPSSIVHDDMTFFHSPQHLVHHIHLTYHFDGPQHLVHHSHLID